MQGAGLPVARFNGSQALGQNQTRYLLRRILPASQIIVFRIYPACFPDETMGNTEMPRIFTGENLLTFKHTPEGFDPELDESIQVSAAEIAGFGT